MGKKGKRMRNSKGIFIFVRKKVLLRLHTVNNTIQQPFIIRL